MRWTLLLALFLTGMSIRAKDHGLIGHWKLSGDANDASGHGHHGRAVAVDLAAPGPSGAPRGAARFDGKSSSIEVPADPAPPGGKGNGVRGPVRLGRDGVGAGPAEDSVKVAERGGRKTEAVAPFARGFAAWTRTTGRDQECWQLDR